MKYIYPICITMLAVFFLSSLQGCMNYYKAQTFKTVTAREIKKYDYENKYFIVHRDTLAWHLSGIEVNDESLAGNLSAVPAERSAYQITKPKGGHRYKGKDRYNVLDQVHLYLQDSAALAIDSSGHIKVALTDIKKIEVYQKAKGRTTFSWVFPPVLTVGVAAMVAAILVAVSFYSSFGSNWPQ
jgi:hypothetical protein